MMDHASLVGKLRDIHTPLADGVSVFVIMTSLGGIFGVGFAYIMTRLKIGNQSIYTKALHRLNVSRNHSPSDRLADQARLLRDIAITLDPAAAFLRGEEWLCKLDSIFRTNYFTQDSGRIFGEELYKPVHYPDVETIDTDLTVLLKRLDNVRD